MKGREGRSRERKDTRGREGGEGRGRGIQAGNQDRKQEKKRGNRK
jgi:hypothetical protein